jgi:hypothetical protein
VRAIAAAAFILIAAAGVVLANPAHDKLIALDEADRAVALAMMLHRSGERCVVSRTFFQGLDKERNAYWNVGCDKRGPLLIQIRNDRDGSTRILECSTVKAMGGAECFKKF